MGNRSVLRTSLRLAAAAGATVALQAALRRASERTHNAGIARGKRILILGGGFAGAAVAQELARLLSGQGNGDILLVDEDNFLLFTPMLTEAAGGELEASHVTSPLRSFEPRVRFVQGRATSIDLTSRTIEVSLGADTSSGATRKLSADHLVLALGSVTNTHDTPGVAQFGISMKTLADARKAFQRVSACLEEATTEPDPAKRKELLTFVVAGGGFTGVETMAALNDLIRESVRKMPSLQEHDVQTILVSPEDRLLPELTPELATYATHQLQKHKVDIRFKTGVSGVTANSVELKDAGTIPCRTLIWAAGVTPNPLIASLPAPKGKHHGLAVDACCRIPGYPGAWALGDCAEIPQPHGSSTYAPTAQNATREGKQVAKNIVATLHGRQPQPFVYTPMGELALVGRHTGVARVFSMNFSGILAWAMWRAVYLAKMPGLAQQGRVLSDWLLDIAFGTVPVPRSAVTPSPQQRT